jgi:hypothetical protein
MEGTQSKDLDKQLLIFSEDLPNVPINMTRAF